MELHCQCSYLSVYNDLMKWPWHVLCFKSILKSLSISSVECAALIHGYLYCFFLPFIQSTWEECFNSKLFISDLLVVMYKCVCVLTVNWCRKTWSTVSDIISWTMFSKLYRKVKISLEQKQAAWVYSSLCPWLWIWCHYVS